MIQSVLFKTMRSGLGLVRFPGTVPGETCRVLVAAVEPIGGIPDYIANHFTWHRFAAIQIWIFVLFLMAIPQLPP